MYTRCPNCHYSLQISRKQLKKKQGELNCSQCRQAYNGYLTLSKKPYPAQVPEIQAVGTLVTDAQIPKIAALKQSDQQVIQETEVIYAWQKDKSTSRSELWLIGIILGVLVFTYQIYYFTGYTLSQNPHIRPWLKPLSSLTRSPLPDYRKPLEFTTVGSSLGQSNKGSYRLQVSLINHADFSQPPPYLELTLQNFYGGVIAQRIFSPQEYLGKPKATRVIQRSAILEIDVLIAIAIPEQEIGGYTINLK